ncbi:MAG: radical SAM protein [Planctomycetia bacterium]|nr:radical SAM protein [Planctomycetia bacterium]
MPKNFTAIGCLSGIPTVNLSAGCAHECVYCYTKGYSFYPSEGVVRVYRNSAQKIRDELSRKRQLPRRVYFSPSSDIFQPVTEIQEIACEIFQILLERGIEIVFLSKGVIPDALWSILEKYAYRIFAQVGLISVNEAIRRIFEPHAATVAQRLAQIERLNAVGIRTTVRLDPILPGVSDSSEDFDALCAEIAQRGAREIAASVLFLRPGLLSIMRKIGIYGHRGPILSRKLRHFLTVSTLRVGWISMRKTVLPRRFQQRSVKLFLIVCVRLRVVINSPSASVAVKIPI